MAKTYSWNHRAPHKHVFGILVLSLCFTDASSCLSANIPGSKASHGFGKSEFIVYAAQGGNADFKIDDVMAEPGISVKLKVRLPSGWMKSDGTKIKPGFLMLEGLPEGFQLSKGFKTGKVWAVDLDDISAVKLQPPVGFTGDFVILVRIHAADGRVVSASKFSAAFKHGALAESAAEKTAFVKPADEVPSRSTPVTKLSPEAQIRLLEKAQQHMQAGLIAAARLIYEKLADEGNAQAAYEMAQTFDPTVLKSSNTVGGLSPDIEQARKWYRKAAEMGLDTASARLLALSNAR